MTGCVMFCTGPQRQVAGCRQGDVSRDTPNNAPGAARVSSPGQGGRQPTAPSVQDLGLAGGALCGGVAKGAEREQNKGRGRLKGANFRGTLKQSKREFETGGVCLQQKLLLSWATLQGKNHSEYHQLAERNVKGLRTS